MFKVFDSNIHLTSTNCFKDYKRNIPCDFNSYQKSYSQKYVLDGCIYTGLPNLENYSFESFRDNFKTIKTNCYGFPAITHSSFNKELKNEINLFNNFNYKGCKIHPGLLNIDINVNFLIDIAKFLAEKNLYLMLCTYIDERSLDIQKLNNLRSFIESIIEKNIKINLILAHGGGKYFSYFQNYTAFSSNILLDLSFTYLRYLDTETEELIVNSIAKNNRYISFGTDWPDYSFKESIDTLNKHNYLVKNNDFFQNFLYNNAYEFLNMSAI